MAKIIKLYKEDSKSFKEDSPILRKMKERDRIRVERMIAAYKQKLKNETKESTKKPR